MMVRSSWMQNLEVKRWRNLSRSVLEFSEKIDLVHITFRCFSVHKFYRVLC